MYSLAIGVSHIKNRLPAIIYALLSGLNSATVGITALAAVQLADKAIKDNVSRILVIFGACAGLCYTALWYFPVLMIIGGIAEVVWDGWLHQISLVLLDRVKKRKTNREALAEENTAAEMLVQQSRDEHIALREPSNAAAGTNDIEVITDNPKPASVSPAAEDGNETVTRSNASPEIQSKSNSHIISVKVGILIIVVFFSKFHKLN
jgi:hypothetical protein